MPKQGATFYPVRSIFHIFQTVKFADLNRYSVVVEAFVISIALILIGFTEQIIETRSLSEVTIKYQ